MCDAIFFEPSVSSQAPQQIQIAHMPQQSADQMTQPMVMPVVSMPGLTSCQSGQLLVMQQQQQQPQQPQSQLTQQIAQSPQPQQQTPSIVSTDGSTVTLAPNAQPLPEVAVSMQNVQPIAPPIIPPPVSVAMKQEGQPPSGITTTIASTVTSIDATAVPVVATSSAQPASVDPAAVAAQMTENKAEAIQGILTLGVPKVDNGE